MSKKKAECELPKNSGVQYIDGKAFLQLREAAKLSGINPVILEMGRKLLSAPDSQGGVFKLPTAEMQRRGDEIEQMFSVGLKKVAKALSAMRVKVKSYREEDRLVFWFALAETGAKPKDARP